MLFLSLLSSMAKGLMSLLGFVVIVFMSVLFQGKLDSNISNDILASYLPLNNIYSLTAEFRGYVGKSCVVFTEH